MPRTCTTVSSSPPPRNGSSTTFISSPSDIVDIRQNLPRTYYRELPPLAVRQHAGDARIYAIAVELIRHSDSRLDVQQLTLFLNSFQRVAPLTIGELWAWPSMLKLALIENLRRLADEILDARAAVHAADALLSRIDSHPEQASVPLPRDVHSAYVVQLLHRAREYELRRSPLRTAIEDYLSARGATAEDVVREEHQRQAASQASVANVITSLRLCGTVDWRKYVEDVSLVDHVLRRDPAGVYARMDFLSRDRQRQAVEELSEPERGSAGARRAESDREREAVGGGRLVGRSRRARRVSPDRTRAPRPGSRSRVSAQVHGSRPPHGDVARDGVVPRSHRGPDGWRCSRARWRTSALSMDPRSSRLPPSC